MMFAEFRYHGEQINVEEVDFLKMVEIKDRFSNSRKQPPGGWETLKCTGKGNHLSMNVHNNTSHFRP